MNTNQVQALEAAGRSLFNKGTNPGRFLSNLRKGMGEAAARIVEDTLDMMQAGVDAMEAAAELAAEERALRYWEERGRTAGVTEPLDSYESAIYGWK